LFEVRMTEPFLFLQFGVGPPGGLITRQQGCQRFEAPDRAGKRVRSNAGVVGVTGLFPSTFDMVGTFECREKSPTATRHCPIATACAPE
jgi:hypothetical protein